MSFNMEPDAAAKLEEVLCLASNVQSTDAPPHCASQKLINSKKGPSSAPEEIDLMRLRLNATYQYG
jgi:hypothetical protein